LRAGKQQIGISRSPLSSADARALRAAAGRGSLAEHRDVHDQRQERMPENLVVEPGLGTVRSARSVVVRGQKAAKNGRADLPIRSCGLIRINATPAPPGDHFSPRLPTFEVVDPN
jgi:hypothetical protein